MPSLPDPVAAFSDSWILEARPPKNEVSSSRPYAHTIEKERSTNGALVDVATLFLTNKECPFRCLMCDLWKNTTDETVDPGAIPAQIRWALDRLPPARQIKLYNSGNFFDPAAIPEGDYSAIAELVAPFEAVVVESHPKMVGRRCLEFGAFLPGDLHVAMGLETVHPAVLARLNKRMTLDDFAAAVQTLTTHGMQARAFILLRPPFLDEAEGVEWCRRSLDFAFDVGVECCAIIPTRSGNGVMEILEREGHFTPPSLASLEAVFDYGLRLERGRVFVDLWDIGKLVSTEEAGAERVQRLARMNLSQQVEPLLAAGESGQVAEDGHA